MIRLASIAALATLGLALPAAAQDPRAWNSREDLLWWTRTLEVALQMSAEPADQNRVWWNALTEAELREAVAATGGTWTDEPDRSVDVRRSRIDWPDLTDVMIVESYCSLSGGSQAERACATLEISVGVDVEPGRFDEQNIEWVQGPNRWLSYTEVSGDPRLYRVDHHLSGTSRGRVISDLVLFHRFAVWQIDRFKAVVD